MENFTIQIPIYNESSALSFSVFYFKRLNIRVRYVMDSQRTPQAEQTLLHLGLEPLVFENSKPFIEYGYANFAALSPTDWILRLDCDEVPSPEVIDACHGFMKHDQDSVAGLERHQLIWRDNHFLAARTERFKPSNQRQWRFFNRSHVEFNTQIHSPGIHIHKPIGMAAAARIYHLSWVFLSWEDRLRKAARYDDNGQPSFNRTNQLFPLDEVEWQDLDAPFLRDTYAEWLSLPNP